MRGLLDDPQFSEGKGQRFESSRARQFEHDPKEHARGRDPWVATGFRT
jgi:hypothetical protein